MGGMSSALEGAGKPVAAPARPALATRMAPMRNASAARAATLASTAATTLRRHLGAESPPGPPTYQCWLQASTPSSGGQKTQVNIEMWEGGKGEMWKGGRVLCEHGSFGKARHASAGRLVGWSTGRQLSRSAGRQFSWSAGGQVSKSAGQQIGRSAGRQASRPAARQVVIGLKCPPKMACECGFLLKSERCKSDEPFRDEAPGGHCARLCAGANTKTLR